MYGKIMGLMLGIVILSLCGCGRDRECVNEEMFLANELLEAVNPENENLAGMLQEAASGVMVQIVNSDLLGSGVIFSMDQEQVVIVTAAHVLEGVEAQKGGEVIAGTQNLKIKLVDGTVLEQEGDSRWQVTLSQESDLGLVVLPTNAISEETLAACRYVYVDKVAFDTLQPGDIILVMGSREEVAGNAYEGSLMQSWIYMEDYGQHMMLGRTYAQPGMSGGGVFDKYGRFIGILSGADASGNLAIVPLSLVLTELQG